MLTGVMASDVDPWMIGLLVFATTLVVAVLLSERASRSVLSMAVLFLVTGFVAGNGMLGLVHLDPTKDVVSRFVEFALFSVLFTDGMRVKVRELRSSWRLPARALFFGIPITLAAIALAAHFLAGLDWMSAFLVGAALSPTDPVFASAIVGHEAVPQHVRRLLNVESGVNDGLALPIVLLLIGAMRAESAHVAVIAAELLGGVALGIVIPWFILHLERRRWFASSEEFYPLLVLGIGILLLALTSLTHTNSFLAAFSAGIFIGNSDERLRRAFHTFGHSVADVFKFAALLVFGALITPSYFTELSWQDYVFVALVLLAARPVALGIALWGAKLSRREWITAAWFGPRGFASVFFALLILRAGLPSADHVFHLLAAVIAVSMIAHSSTDVLVARSFRNID